VSSSLKRWWWIWLALLVCLGLWRLRFDVDILNLLPPDEPTVQGLKLYQHHFANAQELIITLRAPEAERAERLASALATRLRQESGLVAGVSWQPPWMEEPGQLAELLGCLWLSQPPELFGTLTNRLAPDRLKAVLTETKEALTTSLSPMDIARRAFDPFDLLNLPALTNVNRLGVDQGQNMFASSGGTFRVLFVQARPELASYLACASWLTSVRAVVAGLRNQRDEWKDVAVHYTGRPVFVTEMAATMQHDLSGSVIGTAVIIAFLFWLTHRRWLPMFWLLILLAIILAATLALGGLVLGTVNVVSMGFAAVLLGLAVDYAVVHYQEALAHPQMTVPEIRRAIAPSILWAAITTISAFMVLNLGGLPGLAQLGTLVAIGVALAALVMVMVFLPPLFPERRKPPPGLSPRGWWSYFVAPYEPMPLGLHAKQPLGFSSVLGPSILILLVVGGVLCFRRPGVDTTGNALRPTKGEAETALTEMTAEMGIPQDALWVIVAGDSEPEVYQRLSRAEAVLNRASSNQIIGRYLLPTALWPRAEFQAANRATAAWLGKQGPLLRAAALGEGFTPDALFLTEELVRTWSRAGASTGVVWPTNDVSQWLLKRFVARTTNQWLVMGLVYPATNRVKNTALADLSSQLSEDHVLLAGWELLGATTWKRVQARLGWVVTPMIVLVLGSLWLAFRRLTEVLLGLAVLFLSGLCLLAIMAVVGWSWNLLNLMALPLMLGTGVDYSIFMQLALRRHRGNLELVRRSIGRALLLCGGTAIAGFGSLAWSGYAGMASLGSVCAVGIGCNMLISVYLLPAWWRGACSSPSSPGHQVLGTMGARDDASSFYRAGLWRLGLAIVRTLPAWLVNGFCLVVAEVYFWLQRRRRDVVVQNLLPVCAGDPSAAAKTAHRLYRNFARKLADLWRLESGLPVRQWVAAPGNLEIIKSAVARGRGLLFVTMHLGNWEHGGLLLAKLGLKLTVLTWAEPDQRLTDIRLASRARCGIETLIIGPDSFAFVEVIKRLEAGETLAIALDRSPPRNDVRVELFGQRFRASLGAAELARASGCALVGVTIVRCPHGYAVKVLPEFKYDRQALGNREARQALTQEILRAFEPEIRQHLDQWYQFAPIWPTDQ
jgi:predicted RND superfamily exporter protein/lauroyl/myristoyl acyltransferase